MMPGALYRYRVDGGRLVKRTIRSIYSLCSAVRHRWLTVAMVTAVAIPAGGLRPADSYPLTYPSYYGNRFVIPESNPLTREGVALGRALFYEPALSSNGKVSCATCHQQKYAFTDNRRFSIGVDGVPTRRNAMSLANLLWVRNLLWDGRSPSLEEQAVVPLTDTHEMDQLPGVSAYKLQRMRHYPPLFKAAFGSDSITGENIVKAIAQFERTLISADAPYDRYLTGSYEPAEREQRGMDLFMGRVATTRVNCVHCHGSPRMMVELFHNNGLDATPSDHGREDATRDVGDRGRFRVPTLRNIALTAPYMHDGRFNTLEEVLDHYSDHIRESGTLSSFIPAVTDERGRRGMLLTPEQKEDIVSFLQMLTDSTFVTNPEFGPPAALKIARDKP